MKALPSDEDLKNLSSSEQLYVLRVVSNLMHRILSVFFEGFVIVDDIRLNRTYIKCRLLVESLLEIEKLKHLRISYLPQGLVVTDPDYPEGEWELVLDSDLKSFLAKIEEACIRDGEKSFEMPWLASFVYEANQAIDGHLESKTMSWNVFSSPEKESATSEEKVSKTKIPQRINLIIGDLAVFFGTKAGQYSISKFAKARGYADEDFGDQNKTEIVSRLLRDSCFYGIDEMIELARSLRRIHKLTREEEDEFDRIIERTSQTGLEDWRPTLKREAELDRGQGSFILPEPPRFEYDVALSFAGEDRGKARQIAKELLISGIRVFYDELFKSALWGKKLTQYFQEVYGPKTRYVLVLISKHYPVKDWTDFEFSIARKEAPKRSEEFILPVKLDETKILGIHEDVAFLDFEREGAKGIAELLSQKLNKKKPKRSEDVFVATVGIKLSDLVEHGIIAEKDQRAYVDTCDSLEKDLKAKLDDSPIGSYLIPEPSFRDGEGLSVRFVFKWNLAQGIPEIKGLDYWNVLEFRPVEDVYPESYLEIVKLLSEQKA